MLLHFGLTSTKKAFDSLRIRELEAFHILGRLPDVYQFHFFTPKQLAFKLFPPVLQSFCPVSGA